MAFARQLTLRVALMLAVTGAGFYVVLLAALYASPERFVLSPPPLETRVEPTPAAPGAAEVVLVAAPSGRTFNGPSRQSISAGEPCCTSTVGISGHPIVARWWPCSGGSVWTC
jgi:hypothetical protein